MYVAGLLVGLNDMDVDWMFKNISGNYKKAGLRAAIEVIPEVVNSSNALHYTNGSEYVFLIFPLRHLTYLTTRV